ncbi:MAG: CHAD domain-containing protein [Hyphomicrobium sp.]
MADETELKLELSSESADTLLASDLFGGEPQVVQQNSIYFDTPDHALRAAGYSLRIRKEGEARKQTVKATKASTAGLFARSEWEFPVERDEPVIDHVTPLRGELGPIIDQLVPQFKVRVTRHKWTLTEAQSEIEVVLDIGVAEVGDRQTPICEIELELKDGNLQGLFILARKIEATVPFSFGVMAKSERGYRLLEPVQVSVKAEPVELDRQMSPNNAFQAIAYSCLRHFRLNETIFATRQNAAALHQTRVALRRLRSAYSLFKPIIRDTEATRLQDELKWLASVLGEARNIDVLLADSNSAAFQAALLQARTSAYRDATAALESSRARALMLDMQEWLACGPYLSDRPAEGAGLTSVEFAAASLDRLRKKIKKHSGDLAKADDEHRHQVRKDAKRLRYAAEFFASLFDTKKSLRRYKRFISSMEALQDQLGVLNDMATKPQVFENLGIEPDMAPSDKASKDKLLDKAEGAVEDLLEAKRFWR